MSTYLLKRSLPILISGDSHAKHQTTLQHHHQNYQQHNQIRFNLYYSDMAKSSNNTLHAKKDIETLAKRLISRNYISGYIWVLAFDTKLGLHVQVIFYIDEQQHDALVAIAIESYWKHVTENEGKIVEFDVEENAINQFSNQLTSNLFKHHPNQFYSIKNIH